MSRPTAIKIRRMGVSPVCGKTGPPQMNSNRTNGTKFRHRRARPGEKPVGSGAQSGDRRAGIARSILPLRQRRVIRSALPQESSAVRRRMAVVLSLSVPAADGGEWRYAEAVCGSAVAARVMARSAVRRRSFYG
jgi:hypothetical protein